MFKRLLSVIVFWVCCISIGIGHAQTSTQLRDLELSYLRAALPSDLLDYAHVEIPALDNIRIVTEGSSTYLGLRTYYGQPLKNGGVRAELSIDYPYKEGETITYSWRFLIPQDFVSDTPQNRWWLFADWHDQPDVTKGETWSGFPSHSPPIAIGYGVLNGADSLAFVYGAPSPATVGVVSVSRGVWHSVSCRIVWSRGSSGKAEVFIDGSLTPMMSGSGPNMYNAYQHYMKLGSYRNPDIKGDTWIYVRDVSIRRGG